MASATQHRRGADDHATTGRISGVNLYYSPAYAGSSYAFDTTRKSRWIATSLDFHPIADVVVVAPIPLTQDQVEAVHSRKYVNAVRTGTPKGLAGSSGLDWNAGVWDAVTASNGGIVQATLEALIARQNAGSLSSGLHHATAGSGSGFCTFNGLALSTYAAIEQGAKRVLILDLDAHCGGGTNSLIGRWREVVHLDLSVSGLDSYKTPRQPSSLDVVGRGFGGVKEYFDTLRRRLAALDGVAFDVVIYNAGMDPHEGSGIGGLRGMNSDQIARREQLTFEWAQARKLPVAFCLAGGYVSAALTSAGLVALHRLTIQAAARSLPA